MRPIIPLLVASVICLLLPPGPSARAATDHSHHPHRSLGCIFDQMMLSTPPGRCYPRARHYPRGVLGPVHRAIYDGALVFGIPYRVLLRIAICESSLNPLAVDGPHYGLFQFLPATFAEGQRGLRAETGIEVTSYWDALDASYVAGYLFATGYARRWACEP